MADNLPPEIKSASRQKSCNACVKAKRGCDKRHPVCSRCEQKSLSCIFTKRKYGEAFHNDDFGFDSIELDMSWGEFDTSASSTNVVDGTPFGPTTSATLDRLPDLDFIEPFISFENHAIPLDEMQLISSRGDLPSQQRVIEQAVSKFDYAQMADICIQYEPWHLYDPNTKAYFIVQTMKCYTSTFAKDNQTPWMHRYLYKDQMQSSIQSCFTVSVLYNNMNSSNKASVFRVLCQSINELKQQSVKTPGDKLARVQALFLYQIICLFDGDVTLRSNADRDMSLLQDWVDELCKIRENLGTPESTSSGAREEPNLPRSWEWWIFSESVRRTIVIAYAFLGMWSVMCKNDADVFGAWKYIHYWTVSRSLWEAPSSFDFFLTWKKETHHVVGNFEFENFIKTGAAGEVDDFSKLMIVTCIGLDATKQWFMDMGSVF